MRVVIGTAGHVDHGKTALVRALTGIDTDRLPEEKRRGITTELGFAHLTLPSLGWAGGEGIVAGVVDVPGHEKFVRAMAAGAGGVDLVVLVVAADEGVMPQTREHLDICRLLDAAQGLVAVTKCDLLPALGVGILGLLESEIRELCRGTFLEGCPVLPVSAATGEGLDALRQALARLAGEVRERPADGPLFLPLDRAFSLKGFGTVVTGTLLSGALGEGDEVALLPPGDLPLRVRSVQVHGEPVRRALAGQRTAVNLPGVETAAVRRGQALAEPGVIPPSSLLDVEVSLLAAASHPLKHRARLLLNLGTAQVGATVVFLDRGELSPGGTVAAQLRLAAPVAAFPGQRFILRGFAALEGRGRTVAGGRVLAVAARRRRRARREAIASLAALGSGDLDARVGAVLSLAGPAGLEERALTGRTGLSLRSLQGVLERLGARGQALLFDRERRAWVGGEGAAALSRRLKEALEDFHRERPLAAGMGREALRGRLPAAADARLFQRLLLGGVERGELVVEGDLVRLPEHVAGAGGRGALLRERVAAVLGAAGLTPPRLDELPTQAGAGPEEVRAVLKLLVAEGRAVRVSAELYYDTTALSALEARLVSHLREHQGITTQEFKELVGATRKHVIPLAEHFDREKVTLRIGERRVLRGERKG
ncbi:MAG TPA: selenocysteine-specific translation elongation factor [Anaeromyxobacter sp.]|nr:selenocysteine-specific translation elongation factor [Anaeromyxobacter sp.]